MKRGNKLAGEVDDPIVADALKHFKSSVDAWSETAYTRPRTVFASTRRNWRLAGSWALGCLLSAGSVGGALYERHARQEAARITAIKAAEQRAALEPKSTIQPAAVTVVSGRHPIAARRAANEDDTLLATVDSDVSRQVPAAMEPLAQMMETNGAN